MHQCKTRIFLAVSLVLLAGATTVFPVTGYASVINAVYTGESSGFIRFLVYYGWLSSSNILDLNVNMVVVAGSERILPGRGDSAVVSQLMNRGVRVFAYLEDLNGNNTGVDSDGSGGDDTPIGLGSSFRSMVYENTSGTVEQRYDDWLSYLESVVNNYAGIVSGVFLDECDPSYFTDNINNSLVKYFTWGIGNLTEYAHSKGLDVFINGVMGYAGYGDYYLWEDFLDAYDDGYILLDSFLENQSYNNPLEWVNGLSRYYYLRQNNLLQKTIAVSFVDVNRPETLEWGRAAYLLARIMGLAGWGYGNYTYYASGGSVPAGLLGIYETGMPVGDPEFTSGAGWRFFLATGNISVIVGGTGVSVAMDPGYTFPMHGITMDGSNTGEYSNLLQAPVSGSSSKLRFLGSVNSQATIYYFVNWSYTSQPSTGGLLHIYLDIDGDNTTGYLVDGVGADYLVEVTTDGSTVLYNYTGIGTDWKWRAIGDQYAVVLSKGSSYQAEIAVGKNKLSSLNDSSARYTVRTVYNWTDDTDSGILLLGETELLYPTFYEPETGLENYTGTVLSSQLTLDRLVIISEGPPGRVVNYTIIIPFQTIDTVLLNGSTLQQGVNSSGMGWEVKKTWNGYSEIMILAPLHSLINLTIINGTAQIVPGLRYFVILVYAMLFLFVFFLSIKTWIE